MTTEEVHAEVEALRAEAVDTMEAFTEYANEATKNNETMAVRLVALEDRCSAMEAQLDKVMPVIEALENFRSKETNAI